MEKGVDERMEEMVKISVRRMKEGIKQWERVALDETR